MAHIELSDQDDILIQSEFREKELCKQIPGARWDKESRVWRAPLSWASCITLRGVFGQTLTVGEKLSEWSWAEYNDRVKPATDVRTSLEEPELMATEEKLYPFQRSGVKFLELAGSALIADEMGAGKTIQLIRTVARGAAIGNYGGTLPVLVVAPNTMKYTWAKEFSIWAPELKVTVVQGGAVQRRKQIAEVLTGDADVLIMNWESLRLHSRLESFGNRALSDKEKEPKELNKIDWSTVIADEAHKAKDPKAKQTRALWAVSRGARFRYAATGTPIANQPGELWSIMNFVDPVDFPAKSRFVDRYCDTSFNRWGGMDILGLNQGNAAEFHQIMDSRMIRRTKDVVLPYLPPKVFSTREVEMKPKQAKAYNMMAETMLADIEGGLVAATNPLAQLTRLSQFACAYAEVTPDGKVQLQDPSNKVDALEEIVEEAEGQQIVVFSQSRQLIELAEARLKKNKVTYGKITGTDSPESRQQAIEDFQAGNLRVMLATLAAGGVGITLTAASIAVFLQRSWSMVENKQAEDRIHRPGQDANQVEIIDIITRGTVEEYRMVRLAEKEDRLQEVVQDDVLRAILRYRGE